MLRSPCEEKERRPLPTLDSNLGRAAAGKGTVMAWDDAQPASSCSPWGWAWLMPLPLQWPSAPGDPIGRNLGRFQGHTRVVRAGLVGKAWRESRAAFLATLLDPLHVILALPREWAQKFTRRKYNLHNFDATVIWAYGGGYSRL